MKHEIKFNLHNRFDLEVIRNGEVKQTAYAENIILDSLWVRLLAPNTYFNYIAYGTGTGAPAATDTTLFTHLGLKAVTERTSELSAEDGWFSLRQKIQLLETEHVGSELSEVGIAHSSTSSSLVTHAMLRDMNGNEITIIKSDTDIINIYATVFVSWETAGYDGGSIKFITCRNDNPTPFEPYKLMRWLAGVFSAPPKNLLFCCGDGVRHTGCRDIVAIVPSVAYSAANKKVSYSCRVPAATGNNSCGFRSVGLVYVTTLNEAYAHVSELTCDTGGAWYPHTEITGEAIGTGDGVTTDFATVFPFVRSGAKIYVDSVEQTTGVTVHTGKPNTQIIDPYLKVLEVHEYSEPASSIRNYGMPVPGCSASKGSGINQYNYCIFENPFYETAGLTKATVSVGSLYCSNDRTSWTSVSYSNIAAEYRNCRYWKFVVGFNNSTGYMGFYDILCPSFDQYKNIRFDAPPAAGAVITADYITDTIAKDENHVFDFTLEISLAERTV